MNDSEKSLVGALFGVQIAEALAAGAFVFFFGEHAGASPGSCLLAAGIAALVVSVIGLFGGLLGAHCAQSLSKPIVKNTAAVIAAVGLLLAFATSADACNRCGRVGNACRYYVAPVVKQAYVAPQVTQHHHTPTYNNYQNHKHENHQHDHHYDNRETLNLVFNNSYPLPLLAQQGNTAYGVSLALKDHSIDPQLFMDRAARYMDNAQQSAADGFAGFISAGTLQLNSQNSLEQQKVQGFNAIGALNAAKGETGHSLQLKFNTTVGHEASAETSDSEGRLAFADSGEGVLKQLCASCHKQGGKAAAFKPETAGDAYLRWGEMAHFGVDVPDKMTDVVKISAEQKEAVSHALLGLSISQ